MKRIPIRTRTEETLEGKEEYRNKNRRTNLEEKNTNKNNDRRKT